MIDTDKINDLVRLYCLFTMVPDGVSVFPIPSRIPSRGEGRRSIGVYGRDGDIDIVGNDKADKRREKLARGWCFEVIKISNDTMKSLPSLSYENHGTLLLLLLVVYFDGNSKSRANGKFRHHRCIFRSLWWLLCCGSMSQAGLCRSLYSNRASPSSSSICLNIQPDGWRGCPRWETPTFAW